MITRADIVERVAEWGLSEEVVEKDYIPGWLLWGIGTDPALSQQWVFKGEAVRFAATNHLLVELRYQGRSRLIEPYALRRSRTGRLLLHAERADGTGHRSYGIDAIEGIRVTTTPFRPRTAIEFSARRPLSALPQRRRPASGYHVAPARPGRARTGPVYVYRCMHCGREFTHTQRSPTLRKHKTPHGTPCPSRHGAYLGMRS